jgi:hypothetical protein
VLLAIRSSPVQWTRLQSGTRRRRWIVHPSARPVPLPNQEPPTCQLKHDHRVRSWAALRWQSHNLAAACCWYSRPRLRRGTAGNGRQPPGLPAGVSGHSASMLLGNVRPPTRCTRIRSLVTPPAISATTGRGSIKPAISGVFAGLCQEIAVGERTYNAPPRSCWRSDSFDVEDLYIGWRSKHPSLGENALDVVVGSAI